MDTTGTVGCIYTTLFMCKGPGEVQIAEGLVTQQVSKTDCYDDRREKIRALIFDKMLLINESPMGWSYSQ